MSQGWDGSGDAVKAKLSQDLVPHVDEASQLGFGAWIRTEVAGGSWITP